jgi:photosystem II stability/assembly factor-like uncharacterized protein
MASILYVGTDEGVVTLKSDNGREWKVASHSLKDWEVPEVVVSPSAPNKVFAGTRGDGVWLSEDFGATWKKPSYGKRGPGKVRCLSFDPHDANTLYAGTEPIDVFVSRDEAKSWSRLDSVWDIPWVSTITYPVTVVEPHVRDITIDAKNPQTMYVALQVGYMLKTTDGGKSWNYSIRISTATSTPSCFIRKTAIRYLSPRAATIAGPAELPVARSIRAKTAARIGRRWRRSSKKSTPCRWSFIRKRPT